MWTLELVILVVLGLVLVPSRNLFFKYQIIGHILDVIGRAGVQDKLFEDKTNAAPMRRMITWWVFLTKQAPGILIGVLVVVGSTYFYLKGTPEVNVFALGVSAILISGVITWLWTFNPIPLWLYEWQLIVLKTQCDLDLVAVQMSLKAIQTAITDRKPEDTFKDGEVEFLTMQVAMLSELAHVTMSNLRELEQQQRELYAPTEQ